MFKNAAIILMGYRFKLVLFATAVALLPAVSQSAVLDEMTVTAQKREQALSDVGVSVTAFSGDSLRELNMTNSVDISAQTPNFTIGTPVGEGNNPSFVLRGVGLNDFNDNNESNIAVYVDEVYRSAMAGLTFQMFDLDRVEVLRGPQGTLYGRNATGGLVHFVTRKPTEDLDAYADLTLGSNSQVKFEGAIGGGSETVMGRLSVATNQADGYVSNRAGADPNEADNMALRGQLLFKPTEQWSVLLNAHWSDADPRAAAYQHEGTDVGGLDFFGYSDTDGDVWAGDYDRTGPLEIENTGASISIDWQGDAFGIAWITGYENVEKFHQEDTDMSDLDFGGGSLVRPDFAAETDQLTSELRFHGGNDKLNWVAGLYYFDSEVDGTGTRLDLGGLDDVNFDVAYLQDTTSYAVFGQFDYAFNEQWQVVAGLRYTDEEKDYTYINTETNFGAFVYEFSPATVGSLASQSDDVVSGKLGLNYRPTEDWLVFASVSTAFKSGGFNAGFLDPSLDFSNMPFDKEELTSFELGFKWANASDTIRLNTTAFYYDYEDLQALSFEGVSSFISNASDAEIYGAEFELIASPVENFEMILGLGILDASADGISLADGSVLQNRNLVLAPDLQMNGLARYSVPMGARALVFQVDATYSDEVYFDIVNQPVARQSSYSVWNAQVSYQINHNFEVSGWVRNLTDEEYKVYTFDFSDFFGFNQQFYGPPRWYGVSLSYQY